VQETFSKAFTNAHDLRDEAKMSARLGEIAVNLARDRLRRMARSGWSRGIRSFSCTHENRPSQEISTRRMKKSFLLKQKGITIKLDWRETFSATCQVF
jgi:DNA-directed RNA polymerase specialized sigma24 family protein